MTRIVLTVAALILLSLSAVACVPNAYQPAPYNPQPGPGASNPGCPYGPVVEIDPIYQPVVPYQPPQPNPGPVQAINPSPYQQINPIYEPAQPVVPTVQATPMLQVQPVFP